MYNDIFSIYTFLAFLKYPFSLVTDRSDRVVSCIHCLTLCSEGNLLVQPSENRDRGTVHLIRRDSTLSFCSVDTHQYKSL